jgi:DNA-binding CsgD family transcriptional regulator
VVRDQSPGGGRRALADGCIQRLAPPGGRTVTASHPLLELDDKALLKAWRAIPLLDRAALPADTVTAICTRLARVRASGMSAAELLAADFPEVRRVLGDHVQEGVTIVGGAPKSGKTTLMRQGAEAVAIGGPFLDVEAEEGDVGFMSLEEGPRLFRKKLQGMRMDPRAAAAIDLHFEWPQGAAGCTRLGEYLEGRPRTRLVVIDSLSRFRESATAKNVTQFQADYDAICGLSAVAKKYPGLAIAVIHHTRKVRSVDAMDDISGTYGLTAAADAFLVLRKEGRGGTLHAGGRLWDRDDSDFNLTRAGQRWQLLGVSDGLTDKERSVLRMVKDSGGMGPTDLAKVLNVSRQTCYAFLDSLLAKGKVEKRDGFYLSL